MSQNIEARIRGLQPQLPLLENEPEGPGRTDEAQSAEDRDWHLDERTREIGRRGIAAARAHLRPATGRAA